jgi:hypothetical protein
VATNTVIDLHEREEMVLEMVRMKEEEEAEEVAEAQQRVAERVGGLKDVTEAAFWERHRAQYNGEDVGWGCPTEEWALHAPPGATDKALRQHLDINYDPDARAKLKVIGLHSTQVTDAAAIALAIGCPGLLTINLHNTQVTDAAATALAKGCPGLRYIDLSNTQVTPSLAKCWSYDATAEQKQEQDTIYGGTIADFRKQLRRVTNKKQGKGKKKRR